MNARLPQAHRRQQVLVLGKGCLAEKWANSFRSIGRASGLSVLTEDDFPVEVPESGDWLSLEKWQKLIRYWNQRGPSGAELEEYERLVFSGDSTWANRIEFSGIFEGDDIRVICAPTKSLSWFANRLQLFNRSREVGLAVPTLIDTPFGQVREWEQYFASIKEKNYEFSPGGLRFSAIRHAPGRRLRPFFVRTEEAYQARSLQKWIHEVERNCREPWFTVESIPEGAREKTLLIASDGGNNLQILAEIDTSIRSSFGPEATYRLSPVNLHYEKIARTFFRDLPFYGVATLVILECEREVFFLDAFPHWEETALHLTDAEFESTVTLLLSEGHGTSKVSESRADAGIGMGRVTSLHGKKTGKVSTLKAKEQMAISALMPLKAEDSWLEIPQPGIIVRCELGISAGDSAGRRVLKGSHQLYAQIAETDQKASGVFGFLKVEGKGFADIREDSEYLLSGLDVLSEGLTNIPALLEYVRSPWASVQRVSLQFLSDEYLPNPYASLEFSKIAWTLAKGANFAWSGSWRPTGLFQKPDGLTGNLDNQLGTVQWRPFREVESLRESGLQGFTGIFQKSKIDIVRVGEDLLRILMEGECATFVRSAPFLCLRALCEGTLSHLGVREGDIVEAHQEVFSLEAHYKRISHALPGRYRVIRLLKKQGERVHGGEPILELQKLVSL